MRNQKGITLVALIITIIVMVILAGVIIASAVADGGIIQRIQTAAKEHEKAEIKELIIVSYLYEETASINNYTVIDLDRTAISIFENLTNNGFTITNANSGENLYTGGDYIEIEVEGKHGNYEATVDKDGLVGDITETGGSSQEEEYPELKADLYKLRKYFLDSNKYIINIENPEESLVSLNSDDESWEFKVSEGLTEEEANSIELVYELLPKDTIPGEIYIQFNNGIYKIDCIVEGSDSAYSIQAESVEVFQKVETDDLQKLKEYFEGNYVLNATYTADTDPVEEKSLIKLESIAAGVEGAILIGNAELGIVEGEIIPRWDMMDPNGDFARTVVQYNGSVYAITTENLSETSRITKLKGIKVIFLYKIENMDLEVLRRALIKYEEIDLQEAVGKEFEIPTADGKETLSIKFSEEALLVKKSDDIYVPTMKVEYKGKKYIVEFESLNSSSNTDFNNVSSSGRIERIISDVKIDKSSTAKIYYGDLYVYENYRGIVIDENEKLILIDMETGASEVYNIKIYNNSIYIQLEENTGAIIKQYMHCANIENEGIYWVIEKENILFEHKSGYKYEIPQEEMNELNKYFFEMPEEGSSELPIGKVVYGNLWGGNKTFTDDSNTNIKEDKELILDYYSTNEDELYFRYNAKVYKVKINASDFTSYWNSETNTGVELVYQPIGDSKLGKYVKYDNKLWIVLYDDKELESTQGAQLISANSLELVKLGCNDTIIDWENVEKDYIVDGSETDEENIEKAIYSYNNAIDSLNKKSASLVNDKSKIATDEDGKYIIRSVGSDPTERNKEEIYENEAFYESLNELGEYNKNSLKGVYKDSDNNYEKDYYRIKMLHIMRTDNVDSNYWLASRYIKEGLEHIKSGYVRFISGDLINDKAQLCYMNTEYGLYTGDDFWLEQGIRPVITLQPGAINNVSGAGTITDPYILK